MDYSMPRCNGPEATRKILSYLADNPGANEPYICGISAYEQPEFKKEAMDAGMSDFIRKAVTKEIIEDILAAADIYPSE